MARSSTSEYQPAPPIVRAGGRNNGTPAQGVSLNPITSTTVKSNMCCAPATNGSREAGLAPSQPASTKAMKAVRYRIG